MKKCTIIGQAPAKKMLRRRPFAGDSGLRLARLLGVELRVLEESVVLRNVFDEYTGPSSDGMVVDNARKVRCCLSTRRRTALASTTIDRHGVTLTRL